MEQRMTGTFYGVSVGPGDPELLTLQAVRLLRQCPVLAAPQTGSGMQSNKVIMYYPQMSCCGFWTFQ